MDMRVFLAVFATVFLAELGDKTQLATVLFASREDTSPWVVFGGAALALALSTGVAVAAGAFAAQHLNPKLLSMCAGLGFIAIGVWTLVRA